MSHNSKEGSQCTPEQQTEIDKLTLFAKIQTNHMTTLMAELAIEARNPVKQASDTIRTVHDLPTVSMPFSSLLPTTTNKASQFALNSYLYNAKTTMIMLVYPIIIEAVKVRLYTAAIKYEQAFVEIDKTIGSLSYILGTEATLNESYTDDANKNGVYKVNQMYYSQIKNVWLHTNVFNDDMQSTIPLPKESEVVIIDESSELMTLLDNLFDVKNFYCVLTGRHALLSVTGPQKEVGSKERHSMKDWATHIKNTEYTYDHENQSYKVHVKDMLMSLQKLPAAMLLVNDKIGPLFEDYIPLFLERRILHQQSHETTPSCEQYGKMWNMVKNSFGPSLLRDDAQTIVVDFYTRQLPCDIEFSNSIDTLIEDTRRFMHIRTMLLGKMKMLTGPLHNMEFAGPVSHNTHFAGPLLVRPGDFTAGGAQPDQTVGVI